MNNCNKSKIDLECTDIGTDPSRPALAPDRDPGSSKRSGASTDGEPGPGSWVFFGLLVALLLARQVQTYYQGDFLGHLSELSGDLGDLARGRFFVPGPDLFDTGIRVGGPLYAWLHLPLRLVSDPILGLHVYYLLIEAAALWLWLFWGGRLMPSLLCRASAVLIALDPVPTLHRCENLTLAMFLAMPLFLVLLAWLRREQAANSPGIEADSGKAEPGAGSGASRQGSLDPRSFGLLVGAGVLFGAALLVHASALFYLPGLVLFVLVGARRPRRWLRVLGLGAGVALIGTTALPSLSWPEAHTASEGLRLSFDLGCMLQRLVRSFPMPLPLLGLGLVAGLRLRRQPVLPALGLAWLWVAFAHVLLSLALCAAGAVPGHDGHRFGVLSPSSAVLGGAALVWLLERPAALARGRYLAWLHPGRLFMVFVVAALLATGVLALAQRRSFLRDMDTLSEAQHLCAQARGRTESRHLRRLVALLRQGGLTEGPEVRVQMVGPLRDQTDPLVLWLRGFRGLEQPESGKGPRHVQVLLAPSMPGLQTVEGARVVRGAVVIHGVTPLLLRPLPEPRGRLEAWLPARAGARGSLLLLGVKARGSGSSLSASIRGPHEPLRSRGQVVCHAGRGERLGWFLFEPPASTDSQMLTLDLVAGPDDRWEDLILSPLMRALPSDR